MSARVEAVIGDITTQDTDAIVNAANERLRGGGGVDGAIHRAAGEAELLACETFLYPDGCGPGQAVWTPGFKLPAKYIIHTVGPRWPEPSSIEPAYMARLRDLNEQGKARQRLTECYINSIQLADVLGCRSIAFPAISTGIFGYPVGRASATAVASVREALLGTFNIELVRLVSFDENANNYNRLNLRDLEPYR